MGPLIFDLSSSTSIAMPDYTKPHSITLVYSTIIKSTYNNNKHIIIQQHLIIVITYIEFLGILAT